MVSDNTIKETYSSKFRRQRIRLLGELLVQKKLSEITILDIGGTLNYWEMNLQYLPKGLITNIDIINLPPQENKEIEIDGILVRSYEGNALDKSSFRLLHYDLIHSNSVIEHVGNLSAQYKMANIIPTLGSNFWIQTPAKSFPLEPHFYFPFFAYIPIGLRAFLLRHFNLGFHKRKKKWLQSKIICEETRLLNRKEFNFLFPSGEILKEKVFGLTKSYIATNLNNKTR